MGVIATDGLCLRLILTDGFPHQATDGFPHQVTDGFPHQATDGFPHQASYSISPADACDCY